MFFFLQKNLESPIACKGVTCEGMFLQISNDEILQRIHMYRYDEQGIQTDVKDQMLSP